MLQVEEELAKLPENPWLSDQELDRQFDVQAAAGALAAAAAEGSLKSSSALEAFSSRFGCTPLEALVREERKSLERGKKEFRDVLLQRRLPIATPSSSGG